MILQKLLNIYLVYDGKFRASLQIFELNMIVWKSGWGTLGHIAMMLHFLRNVWEMMCYGSSQQQLQQCIYKILHFPYVC